MTWFFSYGSLMWDRQIPSVQQERALLLKFHRAFIHKSTTNWGTPESPGPVLGLEKGGSCTGMAFRLPARQSRAIRKEIQDREGDGYKMIRRHVLLQNGRHVRAIFAKSRKDRKYLGELNLKKRAQMAVEAKGNLGSCADYALKTHQKLQDLQISDPSVKRFVSELQKHLPEFP